MANLVQKRKIVSEIEALHDLKDNLPKFAQAFSNGVNLYNNEVGATPMAARIKGFEASLLNAKMTQSLQVEFPEKFIFGKYKRIVGLFGGYQFLIKKLNKNGMPMNIPTRNSVAIMNQIQLSLFNEQQDVSDALLFFGYKKNKFGEIDSPQIICIDEGKRKWSIDLKDFMDKSNLDDNSDASPIVPITTGPKEPIVTLRHAKEEREAK